MEAEHETEGRLLLDVELVIRKSAAIFELLAGEGEELLAMTLVNGVGGLDLDGDGLSSEGLDESLHTTTEAKNKMEGCQRTQPRW